MSADEFETDINLQSDVLWNEPQPYLEKITAILAFECHAKWLH